MSEAAPKTPTMSPYHLVLSLEMPLFNSIGLNLQQARCSNDVEPRAHRIARLEGVRDALSHIGDSTEDEAKAISAGGMGARAWRR